MARLIWTEAALNDLSGIAEYIALDNPEAASRLIEAVFTRVERLEAHPRSGRRPSELTHTSYREVVVPPCRVFYRAENEVVHILYVMRSERSLRTFMLELRDRQR